MEVYIPPGIPVDMDHVKDVVADSVVDLLVGSRLAQYSRIKWTGGLRSFDDVLLFEGFCGLAGTCFPIWCALATVPDEKHAKLDMDAFVKDWLRRGPGAKKSSDSDSRRRG